MPSDISSEEYETQKRNGPGYCVCLYILHLSVFLQYKLKAKNTQQQKKNWKKNKKLKATPVSPRRPSQVANTLLCNWYTLRYRVALWCYEGTYRRAIYTYRCLLWNTQQNRNFQPKEPVQRAQVARVTVLQDLETCFFCFIFHSFLSFLSLFPPCFFRFLSAATPSAARARACVHLIVHLSIYRSRCWKQSTLSADLSDASPANNRNPSIVVWRWNHLGFLIPNALCLWIQKSIKVPYMNLPRGTSSIIIQDSSRTAQKDIYSIKNWYMYLLCTSLAFYQD